MPLKHRKTGGKILAEKSLREFFGLHKKQKAVPIPHTFGAGNYTAGVDFVPGVYDLLALSGSGNVWCNECDMNEVMGENTTFADYYEPMFMNADFKEGTILHLRGNLQLRMVPKNDENIR